MSIYKKIFEAKKEIGVISKDSTNPFYKSKYFDVNSLLEHVEPILQKHGLLLLQPIKENRVFSVLIDFETGEKEESCIELIGLKDPQKIGSEITYYRRYTLQSLLGLQAEDDDANKASGNKPKQEQQKEKDWFNVGSDSWNKALQQKASLETVMKHYKVSKQAQEQYKNELKLQ